MSKFDFDYLMKRPLGLILYYMVMFIFFVFYLPCVCWVIQWVFNKF